MGRARLDNKEEDEKEYPASERADDQRMTKSESRRLEQPEDQATQPQRDQAGADEIEAAGTWVPGFRHIGEGDEEGQRGERKVEPEDCPPGSFLNQPAAQERTDSSRCGGHRRPPADRPAAPFGRDAGADQRQATGYEQRSPKSLHRPAQDEPLNAGRKRAREGGGREESGPDGKDPAPSHLVTESAFQEEERRHDERVALHHPLDFSRGGAKRFLKYGQSDVHHRTVDERHTRAEDAGGQHPALYPRVSGSPPNCLACWGSKSGSLTSGSGLGM